MISVSLLLYYAQYWCIELGVMEHILFNSDSLVKGFNAGIIWR